MLRPNSWNLDPFLVAVQTVGVPADSQQDEPTTDWAKKDMPGKPTTGCTVSVIMGISEQLDKTNSFLVPRTTMLHLFNYKAAF